MKKFINNKLKDSKPGYFSLLGLLLTIVVIYIFLLTALKFYFKKPIVDKPSEKLLQEQNINTTSYQSVLSDVKNKLKDVNTKEMEHSRELEGQ